MDAEFDQLKREFLAEAEVKVREMDSLLKDAGSSDVERILYLAHQLKGAGGSYGFSQISVEAAALEEMLEGGGTGLDSDAVRDVRRRVGSLTQEIRSRQGELAINVR